MLLKTQGALGQSHIKGRWIDDVVQFMTLSNFIFIFSKIPLTFAAQQKRSFSSVG